MSRFSWDKVTDKFNSSRQAKKVAKAGEQVVKSAKAPRVKVKRYNTTDPYFYIKIVGFVLFFAFVLATIVYFEGTAATTFYAARSMVGVGLLLATVSWMLWFVTLGRANIIAFGVNFALATIVFAISFAFGLGIGTAIIGGLIFALLIATLVFRLVQPSVLPKPLVIRLV